MKTIEELKRAWVNNLILVWDDPDPIKGNDYTISYIEDLSDLEEDSPILIQYNNGGSEAQVFLHEILIK
jgi:hypothetical protein